MQIMKTNMNYISILKSNNANLLGPCFGAKKKSLTTDTVEILSKTPEIFTENTGVSKKESNSKKTTNTKTEVINTKSVEISNTSEVNSLKNTVNLSSANKAILKKIASDFAKLHESKKSLYEDAIELIKKEEGIVFVPSPNYDIKFRINSPDKEITLISSSGNQDEIKVVINSKDRKVPQKTFSLDKSFKINSEEPIDSNKELELILKKCKFIESSKGEKERICRLYKEAKANFNKLTNYDENHDRDFRHMERFNLPGGKDLNMFDMGYNKEEFKGMYWSLGECIKTGNCGVKYFYDNECYGASSSPDKYSMLAIPNGSVWDAYYFEKNTDKLVKHRLMPAYDREWILDFDDENISLPKIFYGYVRDFFEIENNRSEQSKIIDEDDIDLVYDVAVNKNPSKLYKYITKNNKKHKN